MKVKDLFSPSCLVELGTGAATEVPLGAEVLLMVGPYGAMQPLFLGPVVEEGYDPRGMGCHIPRRRDQYGKLWWIRGRTKAGKWTREDYTESAWGRDL